VPATVINVVPARIKTWLLNLDALNVLVVPSPKRVVKRCVLRVPWERLKIWRVKLVVKIAKKASMPKWPANLNVIHVQQVVSLMPLVVLYARIVFVGIMRMKRAPLFVVAVIWVNIKIRMVNRSVGLVKLAHMDRAVLDLLAWHVRLVHTWMWLAPLFVRIVWKALRNLQWDKVYVSLAIVASINKIKVKRNVMNVELVLSRMQRAWVNV
jgi:hypothetical protein